MFHFKGHFKGEYLISTSEKDCTNDHTTKFTMITYLTKSHKYTKKLGTEFVIVLRHKYTKKPETWFLCKYTKERGTEKLRSIHKHRREGRTAPPFLPPPQEQGAEPLSCSLPRGSMVWRPFGLVSGDGGREPEPENIFIRTIGLTKFLVD